MWQLYCAVGNCREKSCFLWGKVKTLIEMVTTVAVTKLMQYILSKWLIPLILSSASFEADGKLTFTKKKKNCLAFFCKYSNCIYSLLKNCYI